MSLVIVEEKVVPVYRTTVFEDTTYSIKRTGIKRVSIESRDLNIVADDTESLEIRYCRGARVITETSITKDIDVTTVKVCEGNEIEITQDNRYCLYITIREKECEGNEIEIAQDNGYYLYITIWEKI